MRLILEDYGLFLGKSGNLFTVYQKGEKIKETSADKVEQIIIMGNGISLSSDAFLLASQKGIDVVFLDSLGRAKYRLLPAEFGGTVITRREQYRAYDDRRGVILAKAFIEGKIQNQAALLKSYAKNRAITAPELSRSIINKAYAMQDLLPELRKLDGEKVEQIRDLIFSIEGRAADLYWKAISSLIPKKWNFPGREKRGAEDPINSTLNYAYAILSSEIWKAVLYAGLDPYAGFLHADRPGKPSLVLDIMEEFRPQISDRVAFKLIVQQLKLEDFEKGQLGKTAREALLKEIYSRLDTSVNYNGKQIKYQNIIMAQSRAIAKFIRGEIKSYESFISRW